MQNILYIFVLFTSSQYGHSSGLIVSKRGQEACRMGSLSSLWEKSKNEMIGKSCCRLSKVFETQVEGFGSLF